MWKYEMQLFSFSYPINMFYQLTLCLGYFLISSQVLIIIIMGKMALV